MVKKESRESGGAGRYGEPRSEGEPYGQHPLDVSFVLQSMNEVQHKVGMLDERTATVREDIRELRKTLHDGLGAVQKELKGNVAKGAFWGGIAVIVAVLIGLAGAYWIAVTAKLDSIYNRLATHQATIQQVPQEPSSRIPEPRAPSPQDSVAR